MISVLLVDDNESNRLVMTALLEDEGFEVEVADSFQAARHMLSSAGARYDVVILDQHLGDGRGTDLLAPLRANLPSAKALLVSGDDRLQGAAHALDAVLSKDTPFPELLATLRGLLG